MNRLFFLSLLFFLGNTSEFFAQTEPLWDNTTKNKPSQELQEVEIISSTDCKIQKAFVYKTKSKIRKPLIVSLHTWSGDYTQKDPLVNDVMARDWNYIHPDFRGANNKPEATCSTLVLSDIEDAIDFALKHTNADPQEVHIIGVSGGGLATLYAYMNIQYPVKSFSAWVPISDIDAWYWESVGRKQKYADDIVKSVSVDTVYNREEALRRSPLWQKFPKEKRENSQFYIYTGIHDGYIGSVPITHSINMYNRLVGDLKYNTSNLDDIMKKANSDSDLISEKKVIDLVTKRMNPLHKVNSVIFNRPVHLTRQYQNIRLTVFEGGHEQIPQALALLPHSYIASTKYNILTIGDSNGQNKGGWVDQLKMMMPNTRIVNNSRSGRTIGFDNLGNKELNALRNIDDFLNEAKHKIGQDKYDYVIVCLGTNDAKNEFSEKQDEVIANFEKLLQKIKTHQFIKNSNPKLIFITPPPMRSTDVEYKYQGGNERLSLLVPELKRIAKQKNFQVIDIYHPLQKIFNHYAPDGVHMVPSGQRIIAEKVVEEIK